MVKKNKLNIVGVLFFVSIFIVVILGAFSTKTVAIDNPDAVWEIAPNDYKALYWESLSSGYRISVEVEVTEGGNLQVNVYLLDSEGYSDYYYGNPFSALAMYQGISYAQFTYDTTYNDSYYVVVENPANFVYTKTVEIKARAIKIEEEKSIQVTSPNYASEYYIEQDDYETCTIQWDTTGDIDYVTIVLYQDDMFEDTIVSFTENDGFYQWDIQYYYGYEGYYFQIKISDYYDDTVYDYSDYFEISLEEEKAIYVSNPVQGNSYTGGNEMYISWSYTGDIDYVDIKLYKGSAFVRTIESYVDASDEAYYWIVDTDLEDINYIIRVSDSYDLSIYDNSGYVEIKRPGPPPLMILFIILGCVAIGAVGVGAFLYIRAKPKVPPPHPPEEQPSKEIAKEPEKVLIIDEEKPTEKPIFCPYCGVKTTNQKYCPACGAELK